MNTRKHPISSARNWTSVNAVNTSPVNFRCASPKTHLSARKLAARLWHLRFFHLSSSQFLNSKLKLGSSSPPRDDSRKKVLRERKLIGDSVLSELLRVQTCINKLKAEHKSSKRKLEEEKHLWKRRECKKNEALVEDLKDKLARERRSRERMESLNSKLVNELAEAKLHARQFMTNYVEEKRKRELIEQVCNELAKQIGENKATLEGIRQEMEEERNMFHMAELWREESIQMKLLDAKLALEDKYNQMIHLIAHLQSFLRSRGDAQFIKQAAESVNVEFSRHFTKSNDVFDELKIKERVIQVEPYYPSNLNLIGPSSTVHIVSLDDNVKQDVNGEDSVARQNTQDSKISQCEGRLTRNAVQSAGIGSTFMCKGSGKTESGCRQWELLGQRNFAGSVNPHIIRGMKGCFERPQGIPKINSKVIIPLEERVRNHIETLFQREQI